MNIKEIKAKREKSLKRMEEINKLCSDENRFLNDSERSEWQTLLNAIKHCDWQENHLEVNLKVAKKNRESTIKAIK